ncbi:MAG: hypothetical protein AB7S50_03740 [Bacteroidales bacterium]
MKRIFLFGILLSVAFCVNAQSLEWGVKNKAKSKWYNPVVLSEDGESVYTTYFDDDNIVIERHDKKGSVVYSNEIKLEKIGGEKVVIENIQFIKGKFILFVSSYDDSKEDIILYALSYSGEDGKKIGKEKKLFNAQVEKKRRKGAFNIIVSSDFSKVLINHYAYYKKEGKLKDRYKLFDSEMNDLMDKTEIINKKEIDYKTMNYVIDNDGSIYFTKKMDSGESFIVSYDATKDYEKWEEEVDVTKLDRSQSVGFVKLAFDNNNDLVIAGICNEKEKDSKGNFKKSNKMNPVGAMYMKIDRKSKEIKVMKIHKFPIETVIKTKDYFFNEQTMHFTASNDLIFINEIFHIGSTQKMILFTDAELIVAKFNSNGDFEWSSIIPKFQVSSKMTSIGLKIGPSFVNIQYFGYVSGINDNKLFIVYNDNPKNLNLKNKKDLSAIQNRNKSISILNTIDLSTGKSEMKQFYDPKQIDTYIKTRVCFQKDYKSDIVSIAQNDGYYQIVRVKLN